MEAHFLSVVFSWVYSLAGRVLTKKGGRMAPVLRIKTRQPKIGQGGNVNSRILQE